MILFDYMSKCYGYYLLIGMFPMQSWAWGFFAHRQINRHAITTLPPAMFRFYKTHLVFLTEEAVAPDRRKFRDSDEAVRHFIDLEIYEAYSSSRPLDFQEAVTQYGLKALRSHGMLPWTVVEMQQKLIQAFRAKDSERILKLSADLGHYVADAHVPLHTTKNYNGQFTDQHGIHALWESRLPILFFDSYDLFVGQAKYISDPLHHIWEIVHASHQMVSTVLSVEKALSLQYTFGKYSFEQTGYLVKKQYARSFSMAYHEALEGQVEARLRQAVLTVGSFWLTAWRDAGSPNLDAWLTKKPKTFSKSTETIDSDATELCGT